MGNNKLIVFIIIFLFLALGCGSDSYDSNREEFSSDLLIDRTAPIANTGKHSFITAAPFADTGSGAGFSGGPLKPDFVDGSVPIANPLPFTLWREVRIGQVGYRNGP